MGMDLTLCPFQFRPENWDWHLATTRLDLQRNYELFEQISEEVMGKNKKNKAVCKPRVLPPGVRFSWYEDGGLKDRVEDNYGGKLTYLEAHELAKVKTENSSPWNQAVFAMIRALDPRTPIVLWWH